jgi:hypothetical protein
MDAVQTKKKYANVKTSTRILIYLNMISEKFGGVYSRQVVCPSVSPSVSTSRIRVQFITSLFAVGFYNYFTEMITILGRHVACNIWAVTLKVKVTA